MVSGGILDIPVILRACKYLNTHLIFNDHSWILVFSLFRTPLHGDVTINK